MMDSFGWLHGAEPNAWGLSRQHTIARQIVFISPIPHKRKLLMETGGLQVFAPMWDEPFVPQCLLSCGAVPALVWSYQ